MNAQMAVIITSVSFLLTYALIVSEKFHRTIVALVGAMVLLFAGIMSQEEAVHAIDFNTIGLLVGMMIVVGITRKTGLFEYLAIKAAKRAKGEPLRILVAMAAITAVASAFLDNVTTVLLIVPVTFSITKTLKVNPIPFLVTEVLASNIGGTATLIGDPPNIMIGGATDLGFMDFVINLAPVVIVIYIVTIMILKLIYRRDLQSQPELAQLIMEFDETVELKDRSLLKKCLAVIGLTVAGFVLHQFIHLPSSVIAMGGASLLMLMSRIDPEEVLHAVEWPTIFFFVGLFVLVGGLEKVGVIESVARGSLEVTGGQLNTTVMLILWLSAIASAFVDNIPFVATMIPLIKTMGQLSAMPLEPLWWALSLGACLGGNGTIIGASANVIVAGISERNGYPISFVGFMKVAFPFMLLSIVISSIYIYLMYLM
ncbi:MAG: ArsB/NhaD family transporter [Firmicutes bacterium]|nr:ArsB/NhaD family transporter [Bacillota bacterium]